MLDVVSVLTVTKRTGWEHIAQKSLESQTYKDFEWIVVSEEKLDIPYVPAPPKTRHSNLSASNNEGLRNCKGDYVMFYQDFIELEPDCIEKLVRVAEETGGFVATACIDPDGNMDGRYTGVDTVRECIPAEWETNTALAPMKAIKELGGFDEEYDDGWAWDNVNLADRAAMLGYKFYLDETNKPKLHFHVKEPEADPSLIMNGNLHEMKMRLIQVGREPLKVPYL